MSAASKFYSADTRPDPLDIVWCYFPENENPRRPGPKARPALVRRVIFNADHTQVWVEVAYGTTKADSKSHPRDLHIQKSAEIDKCGLLRATCFVLDRIARVPWSPYYFGIRADDGAGPIVGTLSENRRERLASLSRRKR